MYKRLPIAFGLLVLLSLTTCQPAQELPENWLILTDFGEDFPLDRVSTEGPAEIGLVHTGGVPALQVRSESEGLSVKVAAEDVWDLSLSLIHI